MEDLLLWRTSCCVGRRLSYGPDVLSTPSLSPCQDHFKVILKAGLSWLAVLWLLGSGVVRALPGKPHDGPPAGLSAFPVGRQHAVERGCRRRDGTLPARAPERPHRRQLRLGQTRSELPGRHHAAHPLELCRQGDREDGRQLVTDAPRLAVLRHPPQKLVQALETRRLRRPGTLDRESPLLLVLGRRQGRARRGAQLTHQHRLRLAVFPPTAPRNPRVAARLADLPPIGRPVTRPRENGSDPRTSPPAAPGGRSDPPCRATADVATSPEPEMRDSATGSPPTPENPCCWPPTADDETAAPESSRSNGPSPGP